MKLIVSCLMLVATTQAAVYVNPQSRDAESEVVSTDWDVYPDGNYKFGFEANNGIQVQESGLAGSSVSGSAKWVDSDGTPFELTYTADENGYHPEGSHLPVAPPVPDYILRALEYIEAHPNPNDPYRYIHHPDPVYK